MTEKIEIPDVTFYAGPMASGKTGRLHSLIGKLKPLISRLRPLNHSTMFGTRELSPGGYPMVMPMNVQLLNHLKKLMRNVWLVLAN